VKILLPALLAMCHLSRSHSALTVPTILRCFITCLTTSLTLSGKLLTYLFPDNGGPRRVFALDLDQPVEGGSYKLFDTAASGDLSLQEQLRRERMRLFTSGIASYEWSDKTACEKQKLLVPLDGKVLLYEDGMAGVCRVIYDGAQGDAVDPHLAPNGSAVAFVINDDLYAMQVPAADAAEQLAPTRLTFNGAKKGVTCGLADYLAQEEMDRSVTAGLLVQ
jgi:dipeptidyl-peptidase-4